ncbi:hypothetical protein [Thioalbus denitrificans]|uniref:Uncharacterized protein n=1 Tax=Thioalbus denitrificans TaxID=547122 RepID=A0A369CHZ4_9GAMM|nr:hypothetical protein [Thioalbus denitrificans]RCX32077.1 hypothetical protein DFQ59_102430 [Thioalbus denitrificans]
MSLEAFHAGLKARLLSDAGLGAWASGHFSRALTAIDGNIPINTLGDGEVPALIFELGDGEGQGTDGELQDWVADIHIALVWTEPGPSSAFAQRLELPGLLARAIIADPSLGGSGVVARLSAFESDRGANHPTHVMRATVSAFYIEGS